MSYKQETAAELAREIIKYSRNELLVSFRFMDLALCRLKLEASESLDFSTDGRYLYFSPHHVFRLYKSGGGELNRAYLHSVLHCIFYHPFVDGSVDERLWGLCSDIAVEAVISELDMRSLDTSASSLIRHELESIKAFCPKLTAERLMKSFIKRKLPEEEISRLERIFHVDGHELWYISGSSASEDESGEARPSEQKEKNAIAKDGGESCCEDEGEESVNLLKEADDSGSGGSDSNNSFFTERDADRESALNDWQQISQSLKVDLDTASKTWGERSGSLMQNVNELNRERYDYADFLRKFSVMGEELQINDEEFDYIFYTYGLELYENVPLVEPIEYKEVRRIKEFVIAIDTSASVEGELVESFVTKTYNMLCQQENFFTKINVHIVQCDTEIQECVKLTNRDDFKKYIENMELRGFGGTDFRPVFNYVQELLDKGEFTNLKGLIYFTDGAGRFPETKPPFDTAFVFVDDGLNTAKIPPWAIKLVLTPEEI
ncbi:MAG: metallopeptidase [Oscillospiraceae bacterium]|nr:metallopeptidase [Oscillospiraceae bacterium]